MRVVILVFLLAACLLTIGCSVPPPRDLLEDLSRLQGEERVTIGWVDGQKLEALFFGNSAVQMRDYRLAIPSVFAATLDGGSGMIFGTLSDPKQNALIAVRSGAIVWRAVDLAVQENPVVAPVGDRLAVYGRDRRNNIDGLYVVEDEGQKLTLVSRHAEGASWSPDGMELLYSEGHKIVMYELQSKQCRTIVEGTFPTWSPDGKWITYRTAKDRIVLAFPTGTVQRTLLEGKNVLTGLSWSPDSQFLMYVQKPGAWEYGPCARYLADGRDVTVYRLRDGEKGGVFQVCDGYPYQRLIGFAYP